MANHLSFRSGNPVLSKNTFSSASDISEVMTINGTVNKTAISLLLLIGTGYLTFGVVNTGILIGCGIGGFIIAIITVFKKEWAPITVPIYAILEGGLLGGISFMYNSLYDGIVTDAIFLTVGILLSLLVAYRSGYIKPTENFKLGIFAATGGIAIVYLVNFVMGFFGSGMGIMQIDNAKTLSIGAIIWLGLKTVKVGMLLELHANIDLTSSIKRPKYNGLSSHFLIPWISALESVEKLVYLASQE